jgi:hypothetical protein
VATGAVAAALVLSHLLQRTCGRGFRLERVRDCLDLVKREYTAAFRFRTVSD